MIPRSRVYVKGVTTLDRPPPRPFMPGRILLTRASLLAERLWERLWLALTLAAVFLGLAFLDVLPRLPWWLHVGLLVALGTGTVVALSLGLQRLSWPTRLDARTALETRGAPGDHHQGEPYHRPLTALEDRPSLPPAMRWPLGCGKPIADAWQSPQAGCRCPSPILA